jgi:hypothetical protein
VKALRRNARLQDSCETLPTVRRSWTDRVADHTGSPALRTVAVPPRELRDVATVCSNLHHSARSFREPDHNWTLLPQHPRSWRQPTLRFATDPVPAPTSSTEKHFGRSNARSRCHRRISAVQRIREVIDRLDGKAVQAVERSDRRVEEIKDQELLAIVRGGLPDPLDEPTYQRICGAQGATVNVAWLLGGSLEHLHKRDCNTE